LCDLIESKIDRYVSDVIEPAIAYYGWGSGDDMADRKMIEATVRAYAAAWAANNRAAWLATFSESATQEDPAGSQVRRGHAEIGEFWDTAMAAYDTIQIVCRDIFVAGQEAAMEWTINAANARGAITFSGVDVFTFDNTGRITSVRAYWERARVVQDDESSGAS